MEGGREGGRSVGDVQKWEFAGSDFVTRGEGGQKTELRRNKVFPWGPYVYVRQQPERWTGREGGSEGGREGAPRDLVM